MVDKIKDILIVFVFVTKSMFKH